MQAARCIAILTCAWKHVTSMLCMPVGQDVGLSTLHMPVMSVCATPATLMQAAVPGCPAGLPMGLPASPGGTPVSGYITHHVEGSALSTCWSRQHSCHCSHFLSSSCSVWAESLFRNVHHVFLLAQHCIDLNYQLLCVHTPKPVL